MGAKINTVDISRAGDRAFLVQLRRDVTVAELHAAAHAARSLDHLLACVVGHSSLYVIFDRPTPAMPTLPAPPQQPATSNQQLHRIPVAFDGADLAEFLARTKQTRDEFTKRVADLRLIVRYIGFRAGFAYIDGWPAEWAMPRRPTSRPVKRGSFAIAGSVAGFYPIDTPGGWNLLGTTNEELEYRFAAGDEIRIAPVERRPPSAVEPGARGRAPLHISAPFMTRITPPDWSRLERGVPVGGPFDPNLASTVAGDIYEFAQIGPKITDARTFAWADLDGVREIRGPIDIGRITNGLRGYLGSAKTEARGPRPEARLTIKTMRGPHDIGIDELECVVTPQLDRIGIRMRPTIELDAPADMPSCGMQFGTLQLHPDGSIVAMGPEHPVTGGYLQPMTVLWDERWKLAHLAPGERVRFVAQSP
jgi:allophanate hydrolase subunit 1